MSAISDAIMILGGLGYDRYSIHGRIGQAICFLWKTGEYSSSIQNSASDPGLALAGALTMAQVGKKQEDGLDNASTEIREDAIFKRVSEAAKEEILGILQPVD